MKKDKKFNFVDVLFFLGAALISLGVGLWICTEAGIVSSGLFCMIGSYLADDHGTEGGNCS